jgi:hypothetical protein
MPDSVLARVGAQREITVADFQRAWRQVEPPARPVTFTPEGAREFLDLLVGKEVLGEWASAERFEWSPRDSAEYRGLRDRLMMRVVLDSALAATRAWMAARGDTAPDPDSLGVAARERFVESLGATFHAPALEAMARRFAALPRPSRDSSLMAQIRVLGAVPELEPGAAGEALATWPGGALSAGELVEAWSHTNPLSRPRVDTADQVADLVRNAVFERELRRAAEARLLERRADIAATLARQREFNAVQGLVAREVYAKLPTDSVTLLSYFEANAESWRVPLRVRLIRLTLPTRAAALEMLMRLANEADAETLAATAQRAGVNYRAVLAETSDSALFRRALGAGPGATLGPDSTATGWRVCRVTEVMPSRLPGFQEVRGLVYQRWYGVEGERLMVEFVERLRRGTKIVVNERAVAGLDPSRLGP